MLVNAPKRIAADVAWHPVGFVNVYFLGRPGSEWVLVDTGTPGHAKEVLAAATARFGQTPPEAIVLTHGHFDHSGNAAELAARWGVPVYAHRLEIPYLTGRCAYPPPDPLVGGFFGVVSVFLPSGGADLPELHPLPDTLPSLPGWRVIPTPGHSPGHISLFRESDATLIAGDAVATVNLESLPDTMRKKQEITGGPLPFNCDWLATVESVRQLAKLRPRVVAAGHGVPMDDPTLPDEFRAFATLFSPPRRGRYTLEAARTDETGVLSVPPAAPFAWLRVAWRGLAMTGGAAGAVLWMLARRRKP